MTRTAHDPLNPLSPLSSVPVVRPRAQPSPAAVDLLAGSVRQRLDELSHDARDTIYADVQAYAEIDDQTLPQEVQAHCRQVFSAFLATVTERRDPGRADFPWTAKHAMRRVDMGITLPDFMKAFRIGQIGLWDGILDSVRDPLSRDSGCGSTLESPP